MSIVTGDRYLEKLVKFVEDNTGSLIDGSLVLKLNPAGLHYVHMRLEAFHELENLLSGAPVDYLRAYVSDLGDHRALEQLRRILRLITSLKVVSVLPPPSRDPTPLFLLPFWRLRVLELRRCDLSSSAAKGLLELRHSLEKIICHDSTDALRHVFASRIAEIKDSPQWSRLSFVSCAYNHLVLMDESLQLLPAVETLDLSRNRFSKVDNLQKCTKLKHLDIGFNHLRTIAPFIGVSSQITKLILRNNALTTLFGIENLKSLGGLDVSYNLISKFSEIEFLTGLPSLQNLWLEGNPLCCARWYRAHIFSYFVHPHLLKLDGKEISTKEFWKRQIIIVSRQKQPASYGFYSPAKGDVEGGGSLGKKPRKVSRLASIESEEESTYFSSDHDSVSCDNEIHSKEENLISDDEAEISDLINKVELMKKEHSTLWLREVQDWMVHEDKSLIDDYTSKGSILRHSKETYRKSKTNDKHHGETSRHIADSIQAMGDETSSNVLESDSSIVGTSVGSQAGASQISMLRLNIDQNYYPHEGFSNATKYEARNLADTNVEEHRLDQNGNISPLQNFDSSAKSYSSSTYPVSPPHYKVDILHRRHNLVEEILQLSADSYSVASTDSDTSSSGNDLHELGQSSHELDQSWSKLNTNGREKSFGHHFGHGDHDKKPGLGHDGDDSRFLLKAHSDQTSRISNPHLDGNDGSDFSHEFEYNCPGKKKKGRSKARVIMLSDNMGENTLEQSKQNGHTSESNVADEERNTHANGTDCTDGQFLRTLAVLHDSEIFPDSIENYFSSNLADLSKNETCIHSIRCDCILEPESLYREREVAIVLSSESKLYVLLIDEAFDGSGNILNLLNWHKVEDIKEVLVGFGLQVIRVCIKQGATYLFPTRSIEKSRELLFTLQVCGPSTTNDHVLRSLEQVQVQLFEKQICGGSKMSIFQYSMVLFGHRDHGKEKWVSRSVIVTALHVLVCVEDLKRFRAPSMKKSRSPYFSLDSCCRIADISELVIDRTKNCVTLSLGHVTTKLCISPDTYNKASTVKEENTNSISGTWNLKWFSENSLLNFVSLLKAIHRGLTTTHLLVTCTP